MTPSVAAVIVAAGRGERAGRSAEGPKQFRRIGDRPVIAHTVGRFARHQSIDRIVVVIHRDDHALLDRALAIVTAEAEADGRRCPTIIVEGGPDRQASVRAGLEALDDAGCDIVLIHDAVRPFADAALIDRVLVSIGQSPADVEGAIPALPVVDTLKAARDLATMADAGLTIERTVDRRNLYAAQTPQGFRFAAIRKAHAAAASSGLSDFTDDASIAEWAGLVVGLVEGLPDNVKLTTARDIALADQRLSKGYGAMIDVRTGNGYDVHQLVAGDHVTLCGVAIPHDQALAGHSDADVGLHALTDALLATCGAGDIGDHFPPSDPQWRGAASRIFVEKAVAVVTENGGRIMNADISLICEAPKIAPHRGAMRAAIAAMTGLSLERVSVKATTNETIGFVGRREGIAAIATASVVYGESR